MPNIFGIYEDERTAVFIDSQHVNSVTVALGTKFDYKRLADYFEDTTRFLRPYLYALVPRDGFNPIHGLLDFISFNGFTVNAKPVVRQEDEQGRVRIPGSFQADMAVDMVVLALTNPNIQHIVLFGGDGDIIPAVKAITSRGIRVTVVGGKSQTSFDLRKAADRFIEFETINEQFTRERRENHQDDAA